MVVGLAGCDALGTDCTLMYAPDNLEILLVADVWAPGIYDVSVNAWDCTVTLPATEEPLCDDGLWLEITADGAGIELIDLTDASPANVEIVIARDGAEVFRADVTPVYDETEPNGEGCGTTRYGSAQVTVP
jgi:hypothetical protein